MSTFPRQTPGWAPRKGRFYMESPPELGLEECTKVLCSPQGAVSRPTPKTNTLPRGALTTRRKQPDFHGPAGGGGRHLLGTGEKCARCPLLALVPERGGCQRRAGVSWAPLAGEVGRCIFLPTSFSKQLLRVVFVDGKFFTRQRCVRHYKSSLTPQMCTKGQPLWSALVR